MHCVVSILLIGQTVLESTPPEVQEANKAGKIQKKKPKPLLFFFCAFLHSPSLFQLSFFFFFELCPTFRNRFTCAFSYLSPPLLPLHAIMAPPPSLESVVTLHSISGKRVTLPYPTTFRAVFDAAVAPPFSFAPESIKIYAHNQLVHVCSYLRQHPGEKDGGVLDASAYTIATTAVSLTGQKRSPAIQTPSSSPATTDETPPGRRSSVVRSLVVYGVPRRVMLLLSSAAAAKVEEKEEVNTSSARSTSPAAVTATTAPRPSTSPLPVVGGTAGVSAGSTTAVTAHVTAGPAMRPTPPRLTRRAGKGHPLTRRSVARDPLPYPHSPDGLLELAKAVSAPDMDSEDEGDLISLLQGAPQRVYNHPTMCYISNKVKGNLMTLRAVMEQIYRVAPAFYAWVEANPSKFLRALNRGGERSLQQVKDQLRLLALQAVAGQMSGDGPSRRVMMLEVNTQDGTPDVYQVEVQVGDFSEDDDDDEDDDDNDEDTTSTSVSMYGGWMGQCDFLGDEEEIEEEEERTHTDVSGCEIDPGNARDANVAAKIKEQASAVRPHAETEASSLVLREEEGEETERHRGAVLLPPATAPVPSNAPISAPAKAVAPSPPSGVAPVRTWRPAPALPTTTTITPAAAAASPLSASDSAAAAAAAAEASSSMDAHEDVRLARLLEESRAVEALHHVYTCQGDEGTAQRVHHAVMSLRPKFFALVGDVCGDVSSAASLTQEAAERAALLLLRRVVRCASDFFVTAEEFYAQLEEEGVRGSIFGASPHESLAAWAAVAALSRLLMCDVDAEGQRAVTTTSTLSPSAAAVAAGPRRIGALRSLHAANSLWSSPALHWVLTRGPEALLAALLQLCHQQRAVLVWYSSHYLVKPIGKTIQTMAYVFGGTEEAQQPVALRRLKITSKAHKSDEVADALLALCDPQSSSSSSSMESARRQWLTLMRTRYQQLVRPIEGDLPTPHMTSNTLYVCDTRHVLPPKEASTDDHGSSSSSAAMESAARWWAGYCDDRSTLCADKWCLAATMRPWNAAVASENAQAEAGVAEKVAVSLVAGASDGQAAEDPLSSLLGGCIPTEVVVATSDAAAAAAAPSSSSSSSSPARHTALLYEQVSASSTDSPIRRLDGAAAHGLSSHFVGDLHIVDVALSTASADPALLLRTRLAGGAVLSPHLATVARNYTLPMMAVPGAAPAAPVQRTCFVRQFCDTIGRQPQMPVAAAARQAALVNAKANDAPWLVCEFVLLDYGGVIRSLFAPAPAIATAAKEANAHTSTAVAASHEAEDFVRMPSVPLSRRLSEPRPVSALSRGRFTLQCDSEGHAMSTSATAATATATTSYASAAEEDALKRQYARTHAIDELYEMMLGSLLEQQPTGEGNVLDHLVNFLEVSKGAMQEKVQQRQKEVAATAAGASGAAAVPVETTATTDATALAGNFASPQPPSTKRSPKGRPSLPRRKSSS